MPIDFSGGASANLINRNLNVIGTDKTDKINIVPTTNSIQVEINGKVQEFKKSDIDSISVKSLGGNDEVKVIENKKTGSSLKSISLNIDGGEGDNIIVGGSGSNNLVAGSGNNTIMGGLGKNIISVGNGDNKIIGTAQVTHGTGKNTIKKYY